jgi:hypothetical protein
MGLAFHQSAYRSIVKRRQPLAVFTAGKPTAFSAIPRPATAIQRNAALARIESHIRSRCFVAGETHNVKQEVVCRLCSTHGVERDNAGRRLVLPTPSLLTFGHDYKPKMTKQITNRIPEGGDELETLVAGIFEECGLSVQHQAVLHLPRGVVTVDVLAQESIEGIAYQIICECKNWSTNVPQEKVHAFRTVVIEAGANRGYIISRKGFQSGAIEAARSTNIELVTFAEFQAIFFDKWIKSRTWAVERDIGDINTYYEPFGIPGINRLSDEAEKEAYYKVWLKYLFVGVILPLFSPYLRQFQPQPYPELPLDLKQYQDKGVVVPKDIAEATSYRELLELLQAYAKAGLEEMRAINPITRGKAVAGIHRDD